MLRLKDGGEVALDWLETDCASDAPIIVILPGLTGESQAEYVKCLVTQANHRGIKCCVFNNRGLGGISLKTPRLYCAANCEDLSEVVNHVNKKYPDVKKGAAGVSMGGLILGECPWESTDISSHEIFAQEITCRSTQTKRNQFWPLLRSFQYPGMSKRVSWEDFLSFQREAYAFS